MSARKIKHWGENSEAAFGKSGKKGDDGEYWFADYYQTLGFIAEVHKGSSFQNKGIDVTLTDKDGKVLTIDVKNNLRKNNEFFVEVKKKGLVDKSWLYNPKYKNEFISHINTTTGVIASYKRSNMQNYINEYYKYFEMYDDEIILLHKDDKGLNFIKWTFTKSTS